nr:M48 family metalloprotease [Salinirubrum litoreum]
MIVTLTLLGLTVVAAAVATGVVVALGLGFLVTFAVDPATVRTDPVAYGVVAVSALGVVAVVLRGERSAPAHTVASLGATAVTPDEHPELSAAVESVARQADVPVPAVYVVETETPLALTTGFTASDARLVVSTGLVARLDSPELRAVVAHELAHVKNRDTGVLTAAAFPVAAAGRVVRLFRGTTPGLRYGQVSRASYADTLLTAGLLLAFPVWACSLLLTASLSRSREYAADRGAAAITGDPFALASALDAIETGLADRPTTDLRHVEVAALAIVEPSGAGGVTADAETGVGGATGLESGPGWFAGLRARLRRPLRTHPPTASRIERLRTLAERTESRELE